MKTFLQFITEMPLPLDTLEFPKTKKGDFISKYPAKQMKDHLANSFQALGKGSSRIGFDCPVSVELFHYDDRRTFELGDGNVDTVIKLALNPKGIFQNTVEVEQWINLEGSNFKQFLCPIFDWSGNPKYNNDKQYVLDCGSFNVDINADYNGAYWIQMAKCIPASKSKKLFLKVLTEKFGKLDLNLLHQFIDKRDGNNKLCNFMKDRDTDEFEEQNYNLYDFIEMCTRYDIGDIRTFANWGIYKNQPVLIDYGYNDKTKQIYWDKGNINFLVFINNTGEIKIRFKSRR